jgi:glycerol kinase
MHKEIPIACSHIRVDGGVSKNNFITQLIADLSGYRVERASTCDHSALGAAFMAGIAAGVFFLSLFCYKFFTLKLISILKSGKLESAFL